MATGRARLTTATLVLALCAAGSSALDPSVPLSQLGHEVWTSDSGLPQNSITAILQTRDGYLWLGTQEGLVRFDGVRFRIFDTRNTEAFGDDWVQALIETRDGALWIGTVTGLIRMQHGEFRKFPAGGLDTAVVEALFESRDGAVWVASNLGASRIQGGRVRTYTDCEGLPGIDVRSIGEDGEGNLWVGGAWGVARWDRARFVPWTLDDGLPGALALAPDPEGGLWVGTGHGLAHIGAEDARTYEAGAGLTNGLVRAVYRDRRGTLWLGTDGGLFRLRDGRFQQLTTADGLSSNRILAIHEDREGSLWVGTYDGGINRLQGQRAAIYTERDGLSDDKLWAVLEDSRGDLWAGTAEGVLNCRAAGTERFKPVARLGASINAIAEAPDGSLWVGTRGTGLVHLEGRRLTRYTTAQGLSGNSISSVLVDRHGTVWVATVTAGLDRLEGGRVVSFHAGDGLGTNAVFSLFEDRSGDIWIGTFGGGVTRFSAGRFQTFTTRDGLAHDVVMSTYQDAEGTFWFATRGGLSRYRDGRFTTFRQKSGLFHDAAQRVLEDGHGYLWLTGNRGVFRVAAAELGAAAGSPGRIADRATFTTAVGMIGAECNGAQHGAWRDRSGRLWFATVKGLAMADPARIDVNLVPPEVVIEQVVADGQSLEPSAAARVPPGNRKIEFGFTALSFRNPSAVRFRYRLDGFEADWTDAGPRRSAYYTNLPPGRYRFQVVAANEDGVWSRTAASIDLEIARHVYQTAWFRTAAALAAALLLAVGYRLRVRRLEARERMRTALVEAQLDALQFQLRPHFLFNTLNSILPLIGKDPERARQMVVRLGDLLRLSLRSEDAPLVTLADEIAILDKYLSIEKVRFRERLEIAVRVEPDVAAAHVPCFLLQPLVENAIKHGLADGGGRGRIAIHARRERRGLSISVRDNGPGLREGAADGAGIGLSNTRRRLEALYPGVHRLELASLPGGGCEVSVQIPLTLARAEGPVGEGPRRIVRAS